MVVITGPARKRRDPMIPLMNTPCPPKRDGRDEPDQDSGKAPARETRPYVGLIPVTAHSAAGQRMEPPVSEPSAANPAPMLTATAPPPVDPPGTRSVSQGLRVGPKCGFAVVAP